MTPRIENPFKLAPEAIKAMMALEASFKTSGLDHALLELVRLRVSQINGCAYCITMHDVLQTTAFAIENGVVTAIYITRNPDKLKALQPRSM